MSTLSSTLQTTLQKWFNRQRSPWVLTFLAMLAIGSLWEHQAVAAVELIYFEAETLIGPAVLLEWETGSETDVAGYIIKRDDGAGPQTIEVYFDNELVTVIPAEGATVGAYYAVEDEEVVDQTTYSYYLYELSNSNVEEQVAVLTIFVDEEGDEPTPFPILTPTSASGSNPRPPVNSTATPAPTVTSAATSAAGTPVPTSVSGSAATPTRRPTISSGGSTLPTPTTALQTVTTQTQPTQPPGGSQSYPAPTNQNGSENGFEEEGGSSGNEDQFTGNAVSVNPLDPAVVPDSNSSPSSSAATGAVAQAEAAVIQVDVSTTGGAQPIGQQALEESKTAGAFVFDMNNDQTDQEDAGTNTRWILWISFLAALLLFIGGVAMALRLFRRR